MDKILTNDEIREIVTPDISFDVTYYETNVEDAQKRYLLPIMGAAFYNDFISNLGSLPANYQTLFNDYIQYIVAFGTAILTVKKDLSPQTSNQGVMVNRTEWSAQGDEGKIKGQLMQLDQRLFDYRYDLVCYLVENEATYPLWDIDTASFTLELRDYIKY